MRKTTTKEELSDRLNEILGLEDTVDFAKMTKEDLETFLKTVGDPSSLIKIGWKNLRNKAKKEILEELLGHPFLDKVLNGGPSKEGEGDKGPLGLGVLPTLRGVLRGTLGEAEEAKE